VNEMPLFGTNGLKLLPFKAPSSGSDFLLPESAEK
jgi:hypothetical protein